MSAERLPTNRYKAYSIAILFLLTLLIMDDFKALMDTILPPIDDTDRKAAEEACKRHFLGTNRNLRGMQPPPPTNNFIDPQNPLEGLTFGEGLKLLQKTAKPKFGPLDHLPCANAQVDKYTACDRPGRLFCSRCKLVAYCAKVRLWYLAAYSRLKHTLGMSDRTLEDAQDR